MTLLLTLTLALPFQTFGRDDHGPEPYVRSAPLRIYGAPTEEWNHYPNVVLLRSARAVSGEYFLLLEIHSRFETDRASGQFANNICPLRVVVNQKEISLPCTKLRLTTIVPLGQPNDWMRDWFHTPESYGITFLAVRSDEVKAVIEAKSLQVKVEQYTMDLTKHLALLRTVVYPAKTRSH